METPSKSNGKSGSEWLAPSDALSRMTRPAPLANATTSYAGAVRFGYRVGSLGFLVGVGVLSELLPTPEIYPIPNVTAAIRGYVNLQGALVPVWDLRVFAGDAFDAGNESVLVLGRGDLRVGILVDGLPRSLKRLERVARPPRLPEAFEGYVKEAATGEGNLWFEFDHEGFFRMQTERAAA